MSDAANMFKKLAEGRQKSTPAKPEEETKPVPKSESPKKAKKSTPKPTRTSHGEPFDGSPVSSPEEKPPEPEITPEESTPKRGRPATGKRSDPDWIGRTYYVRKETDFDVEDELVKLKRAGINLDKSELVDFLLAAWVNWRKGENIDIQLSDISPRRKDELS
ncbi:MAG: hypothetical protein HC930_12010 [Hydrococcus sp. SU_1_0]|nr:hypothetical protein [Hydrococcus sp. SU_1_0]